MMPHPKKTPILGIVLFVLMLIASCSKDLDVLTDAVLNDPVATVENQNTNENASSEDEETSPEVTSDSLNIEEGYETRTTVFYPSEDAYIEEGLIQDREIMRLSETDRVSYMLFDLSPIESIGGYITDAKLQFTIDGDEGNGTVSVYKGVSSEWSEDSTQENAVPAFDLLLGSIVKEYKNGATEEIELSGSDLVAEPTTLVMQQSGGDDIAFASKESPARTGPKLVVTYNAPMDAKALVINEEEIQVSDNASGETAVTANKRPLSIVDASVTSGGSPLTVNFTGSNSRDDHGIVRYVWDFRDGSAKSYVANPQHSFNKAGTYKVILIVKDAAGLTDIDNQTITVTNTANQRPRAKVSATPLTGDAPLDVSFTGSNSTDDAAVTSYYWDFIDGSTSTEANPHHTFTKAGTYLVRLRVKDQQGLQNATTISITVKNGTTTTNQAPVAVAKANPTQGLAPLSVAFNAGSSSDDSGIASYKWEFGDGRVAYVKNPTRIFNTPGIYNAKLTVTDDKGLTHSDTVTLTVDGAGGGGSDDTGGGSGGSDSGSSGGSGSSSTIPAGAVKASSFGFKAGDATSAFQAAIKSNKSVIVIDKQSSDWIVKPSRLFNIKNKTIIFESGVVVRAKSNAYKQTSDMLLSLYNGSNIVIEGYGATIRMNKSEYSNSEFRHAIKLEGCTNVTIKGLNIQDTGGDGICIAAGSKGYSENITVEDVVSSNNKRNGLTVVSGKDVWIRNCTFKNSNGTMPETGLDIEPDFPSDRIVNVNVIGCKFLSNDSAGVQIGMNNMKSTSIPIDALFQDCQFSNNGNAPNSTSKPATEISINQGTHDNPVKGNVTFQRMTFNGSRKKVLNSKKSDKAFHVTFKDCTAKNVITDGTDSPVDLQGQPFASNMGGFTFDNFYIEYSKKKPFMSLTCPKGVILKNIQGTFTVKEPNDLPINYSNNAKTSTAQNYNVKYTHIK